MSYKSFLTPFSNTPFPIHRTSTGLCCRYRCKIHKQTFIRIFERYKYYSRDYVCELYEKFVFIVLICNPSKNQILRISDRCETYCMGEASAVNPYEFLFFYSFGKRASFLKIISLIPRSEDTGGASTFLSFRKP